MLMKSNSTGTLTVLPKGTDSELPQSELYPGEYAEWKKNPTPQNARALRAAMMPQLRSALKSYAGGDPTLQVAAHLEMGNAFRTYTPNQGTKLSTHVHSRLQVLQRLAADRDEVLHVPERSRIDRQRLQEAEEALKDARGAEPSVGELSKKTKLSERRIRMLRALPREAYQSAAEGEKGDTLIPSADADESDLDEIKAYVYHDLSPTNQKIFEWTTGWNGSKVLPKIEIARRLRVSPGAVSQRINTISAKFSEVM